MKQALIRGVLIVRNLLPERYQFYLIGFLSYVHLYVHLFLNALHRGRDLREHASTLDAIRASGKKIIVFLPTTDWHDIKQRPQHLAKAFAESGCIVLFLTKNQTKDRVRGIEKVGNDSYLVENFYLVDALNEYIAIITGPSNYPILDRVAKNRSQLVYDFPDELSFFPWLSRSTIARYHADLVRRADLVTPSASFLEEMITNKYPGTRTQVVLNGVFPEDFVIEPDDATMPDEMKEFKDKTLVGFYGGLGEGWVDFNLFRYCAEKRPQYTFIIIGGGAIERIRSRYDLVNLPNIHFLGLKPYATLKYYARMFRVALIPFCLNDLTLGVSPLKSFEYMVQGIPFVTTGLPECRKYTNALVSEQYEDFVQKIDQGIVLRDDQGYIDGMKAEGKNNTWTQRVSLILNTLSTMSTDISAIDSQEDKWMQSSGEMNTADLEAFLRSFDSRSIKRTYYHYLYDLIEQYYAPWKRIIEIGGQFGGNLYILNDGFEKTLLDIDPTAIEKARELYVRNDKKIEYIVGDMFAMCLPDETFDVIFNAGVLEHFTQEERTLALKEYARILKKDGVMVLAVPNHLSWLYRLYYVFLHSIGQWKIPGEYKIESFEKEAKNNGLRVTQQITVCPEVIYEIYNNLFGLGTFLSVVSKVVHISLVDPTKQSRLNAIIGLGNILRWIGYIIPIGGYLLVFIIEKSEK